MLKQGVEIDFVVKDSLEALSFYEQIFDIKREEVTSFPPGQNEVVFTLYGVRFHMLDENPEYQLFAPKPGDMKTLWFNVIVPDIKAIHDKAMKIECEEVQPVTEMVDMGVSNSMFADPFGYLWMLHQVHQELSFEERIRHMEDTSI